MPPLHKMVGGISCFKTESLSEWQENTLPTRFIPLHSNVGGTARWLKAKSFWEWHWIFLPIWLILSPIFFNKSRKGILSAFIQQPSTMDHDTWTLQIRLKYIIQKITGSDFEEIPAWLSNSFTVKLMTRFSFVYFLPPPPALKEGGNSSMPQASS